MVTSANRNAETVEKRAEVEMMDVAHAEGDNRTAIDARLRLRHKDAIVLSVTINMNVGNLRKLFQSVAGKFHFVLMDAVDADG